MKFRRILLPLSPADFLAFASDLDSEDFNRSLAEQVIFAAKIATLPWPIGWALGKLGAKLNVDIHTTPMRLASIEIERLPPQVFDAEVKRDLCGFDALEIVVNETLLIVLTDAGQHLDVALRAVESQE